MATWAIILGLEAILILMSIVAVVVWVKKGEPEDDLDRRLKELSEIAKERENIAKG